MKLKIPPPIVALVFAALMWGVDSLFPALAIEFSGQRLVSAILVLLGFATALTALRTFRQIGTTFDPHSPEDATQLVRSGVFRISRNPMYLGLAFVLLAWAVWLGNIINVATLFLFVAYLTVFQIKPEEVVLARLFGADYEAYRKEVRRWI